MKMSYNCGTQMDSNQCILLRTQELPRSLILRKHTYYGIFLRQESYWFPFISLTINENAWTYLPPTTNQERRDRTTGPWTCFAHFVWTSKSRICFLGSQTWTKFIKFGHQNPNDAQKEPTFSDEVGEFRNSWCELSSWLHLTPPFFQQAFRARGKSCIVSSPVPQPTCQEKRELRH